MADPMEMIAESSLWDLIIICDVLSQKWASWAAQMVKNLPAMRETWVQSLGQKELLDKGMATYSSIHAWRSPWTEVPGRILSMRLQRVEHD